MRFILSVTTLISLLGLSGNASADDLRCNQKQSFCVTKNKRLTIGDKVAIFNRHDEVVAVAEVRGMQGRQRRLNIERRLGMITRGSKARQIQNEQIGSLEKHYRLYEQPAQKSAGGSIGLLNLNIASTDAYAADGFWQMRWRRGVLLVGRVQGFTASGVATDVDTSENVDFQLYGLTLLPGVAYEFFEKKPISVRPEFNLGLTYINQSVSGSANPRALDRVGAGFGLAARVGADLIYHMKKNWSPMVTVAANQINDSRGTIIGLGAVLKLK